MSMREILKMRYSKSQRCYIDHDGKPMEWHHEDPMRLRDCIVWYMCRSSNKHIQRYGWKKW